MDRHTIRYEISSLSALCEHGLNSAAFKSDTIVLLTLKANHFITGEKLLTLRSVWITSLQRKPAWFGTSGLMKSSVIPVYVCLPVAF